MNKPNPKLELRIDDLKIAIKETLTILEDVKKPLDVRLMMASVQLISVSEYNKKALAELQIEMKKND